jgi:Arc/MetJ-type ribon-helix-helix transcriptional regulator
MKIITVNLPINYLKTMEGLVGENGLYPSRSELVRVALRDFLIREIEMAQQTHLITPAPPPKPDIPIQRDDTGAFVQVPMVLANGEQTYKTYRIVKR